MKIAPLGCGTYAVKISRPFSDRMRAVELDRQIKLGAGRVAQERDDPLLFGLDAKVVERIG